MALLTVFFVVMIDLIGFGIVLPGLEGYASSFNATPLFVGILYSSYSLAQLVFSPVWGSLSDRVGRRPIMIVSTLGAASAYLLFAFSKSLGMLLFCRVFAGVMAGNISTAQAYVADVTSDEDRAKGMGLIGAAFGIGFVIGPALGGVTLKFFPADPYYRIGILAAALSFVSFLCVLFLLPEPVKQAAATSGGRVTKASLFTGQFWGNLKKINAASHGIFIWLLGGVFLLTLGQASIYEAFPFFCRSKLNLPVSAVYHQYVWMGLVAVLIQGGLIRWLLKKVSERRLFTIGGILMAVGLAAIPFTTKIPALTTALIVMTIGASFAVPTVTSMVSKTSTPENYGATMGLLQSFSALARAIGPTWGSLLLGLSVKVPFVATAALLGIFIAVFSIAH